VKDKKIVDIWMATHQRKELTKNAINYLNARTFYPYRLFVIDNNSDDGTQEMLKEMEKDGRVFLSVEISRNVGIHMAHNIGLSLVDSELCVSTDNDIYVPDLMKLTGKCWLEQLVDLMEDPANSNYCAIAPKPHVFLGAKALSNPRAGVYEAPMVGAVMRMMKTDVIKKVGGWDRRYDANRNHEEKTICSRIQSIKGLVGYAEKLTCYHDFGDDDNWGYKDIHPHAHGHRIPGGGRFAKDPDKVGEIWPTPNMLNNKEGLDYKTWEKK